MLATLSRAARAKARPVIPRPAIRPLRSSPMSPAITKAANRNTTRWPTDSATLASERRLAIFASPSTTMKASRKSTSRYAARSIPRMKSVNDQSITFCAIESSQIGVVLPSSQDKISENIRKPIIQPSDFGASKEPPSIRSDFERRSRILGKMNRRAAIPPPIDKPIAAIITIIVPLERPSSTSFPLIKSFNISIGKPDSEAPVSDSSCMFRPTTTPR